MQRYQTLITLLVLMFVHQVSSKSIDRDLKERRFTLKTTEDKKTSTTGEKKAGKVSYYAMVFRNGFQPSPTTCKATEYVQSIQEPGCLPLAVPNKYCGGSCASYFIPIPRDNLSNDVNGIFEDCRQCEPKSYQVVQILLRCPGLNSGFKFKKIVLIKECRCRAIECSLKKK